MQLHNKIVEISFQLSFHFAFEGLLSVAGAFESIRIIILTNCRIFISEISSTKLTLQNNRQ